MRSLTVPELPECDADQLRRALRATIEMQAMEAAAPSIGPRSLEGRLPGMAAFATGAAALGAGSEDALAARHFVGLLEASYLVASADGIADEERETLAQLMAHTAGEAVPRATIDALFDRFAHALQRDGLEGRLRLVAECFEDFMAREEAIGFATLIALSDRDISPREEVALVAFGARLDFSIGELQMMVTQVGQTLRQAILKQTG